MQELRGIHAGPHHRHRCRCCSCHSSSPRFPGRGWKEEHQQTPLPFAIDRGRLQNLSHLFDQSVIPCASIHLLSPEEEQKKLGPERDPGENGSATNTDAQIRDTNQLSHTRSVNRRSPPVLGSFIYQ